MAHSDVGGQSSVCFSRRFGGVYSRKYFFVASSVGLGSRVHISGFWGYSLRYTLWGSVFRVEGAGFSVWGFVFVVYASGWFCDRGLSFRVWSSGYRVKGEGCRVWGVGYRVQGVWCRV